MTDKISDNPILNIVQINSEKWFGRFVAESKMRSFFTSGGSAPHGKLELFIFEEEINCPLVLAKIARDYKYSIALKTEYNNLIEIDKFGNKIKGAPKPYYYGEINKTCFLIESYLHGIPIYKDFNKLFITQKPSDKAEEIINLVFAWIKSFHLLTAKKVSIEKFFERYQKEEFDFNIDINSSVITGTIQGDYWVKNILLNGTKINVIDWEWCRSDLPLVWDVLFFAFSLLRQLTAYPPFKGQPSEFVSLCRDKGHRVVQMLNKKINEYLGDFYTDKRSLPVLEKCFLFYLSGRDYKRYGFKSKLDMYWEDIINISENELMIYEY